MMRAQAVLACWLTAGLSAAAQSAHLCDASREIAVFSCPLAASKTVSVCVSRPGADAAAVVYRFGNPARIALAYPSSPGAAPAPAFQYLNMRLGSKELAQNLKFRTGGAEYTVYSHMSVFAKDERAGVLVKPAGQTAVNLRCGKPAAPNQLHELDAAGLEALPAQEFVDP